VEYRILGPLEVRDGGRSLSLGTAKQQALLAVLVLHANEFVARERLIDELWGASPPPTAAKAIQVYVSHLRKLFAHNGDEAITTRSGGYVLSLDGEGVDALSFERIAREAREYAAGGDAERAASLFREALALWRGPALAGLSFESGARNEVERLEEERLAVLMDRIDCDLSLGRHEQLVGELEGLVAQHPLRERFRGQLMLALYRSGRQSDALRVYREGRETLVEELGLEPSEPLQRLERAILVHDPALEVPAGVARPRLPTKAEGAEKLGGRRGRLRGVAVATAALVLAAIAVAVILLRSGQPAAKLLAPNSVGFIDAASGRITRSLQVGRRPIALVVAYDSLWVANYRDQTVTRLDRASGHSIATIAIAGHPSSLIAYGGDVWVWTVESSLVRIDPRFNTAGGPVRLAVGYSTDSYRGGGAGEPGAGGSIRAAGGYLWVSVPGTTIIRVDPADTNRRKPIVPDYGARGPIASRDGEVWVGGTSDVFPIAADSGIPGAGIPVGTISDLTFGAGTLWVVSGTPVHAGADQALRRLDLRNQMIRNTINVGNNPIRVAAAAGSIWVASRSDATVYRVNPHEDRATGTIPVGSTPSALAADRSGVWVAVD
jgi:DNA-binding SARP family transcriptional activator